ncbi:hypothetical protein [Hyphomicrobium sp. ghe19]|uniref:hypothetical protein n=1 Tax=Hyphomicrobium sp. ghe19 TaxID=2682968 RepID=UPI001367340E|nr:hypothetical protein HYPP_04452 [Hyphomicrobium sp. ghe19]
MNVVGFLNSKGGVGKSMGNFGSSSIAPLAKASRLTERVGEECVKLLRIDRILESPLNDVVMARPALPTH